ncbi:phosphoribosylamine--glycine ligase [Aminirod propionatiphilus]|uniref:Phosphoribosylamine--glycine ligase n=1 Tax=Aminirod propionatiphilus TaxID=3415223 RepID=A0ACD1DYW3_9BACT|nr:phosphoribosylamine--glycine ligase [Synergistota bacterium]
MRVLLLGRGGREHALAWALARSPLVKALHAAPGNPGIADYATCHDIDPCDAPAVVELARRLSVDFVVPGPESPLVAGVGDALEETGIPVFGPGRSGARLEGSKAFSKEFMARHAIATAPFDLCRTLPEAEEALRKRRPPYVVKADGLAAGKGAFIVDTFDEALIVCSDLLVRKTLGDAGKVVIVEDHIAGTELTLLAVTDGKTVRLLPASQDHKRAFDEDRGPNTGGMGAYAPVPWADEALLDRIGREILVPTIEGLRRDAIPFRGVLYLGVMLDEAGKPWVLEYNVRLGDPEAQVVLPVFGGDWAAIVSACCQGRLEAMAWPQAQGAAVGIVLASAGYPGAYEQGFPIEKMDALSGGDILVFHAGTARNTSGQIVTAGGRVLTVVGLGEDLFSARERAYEATRFVSFEGVHFRRDIARKAFI